MPVTLTLRLKVRTEAYPWLNAAAREVNTVWNWCNFTSIDAADRNRRAHARFLSGFDLCNLSAGRASTSITLVPTPSSVCAVSTP
jgi:putative transposase